MNLAAGTRPADVDSLELEQLDLGHQASGEAREAPIGGNHAMAWNHDRDRIGTHGLTDGSSLVRLSDLPRKLAVRRHVPMLDFQELLVDLTLEGRADT